MINVDLSVCNMYTLEKVCMEVYKQNASLTKSLNFNTELLGEDDVMDNILRVTKVNYIQRVLRFYDAPFTKFVTNIVSQLSLLFYINSTYCFNHVFHSW